MAYCDRDDVKVRLPVMAGESDFAPLTNDQVDEIITGKNAQINVRLAGLGHSVPVTSPAIVVEFLRALCSWGVAAEVQRARFREGSGVNTESQWSFYQKQFEQGLKDLGPAIDGLLGAPVSMLPGSYQVNNPTAAGVEPTLTTTMEL